MAIVWLDGFDHYTTTSNMALKWTTTNSACSPNQTGRFGGLGLAVNGGNGPLKTFGSTYSTLIIGCAFKFTTALNINFGPVFYDATSNTQQIGFGVDASGLITVYRGGTVHNATIGQLTGFNAALNQWYYLEAKVTFATSATGSVAVQINGGGTGLSWTFTGVQTAQSSNAYANAVLLVSGISGTGLTVFDDLYVCDTTGSVNNSFRGDSKITTVFPSGAGRLNQWSTQVGGTGGQPYTAIDETNPDGDTSYVADATAGDVAAFALQSVGSTTSVIAVQVNADMRKDDTGSHLIGLGVGNGSTENFDSGTSCNASYLYATRTMDTNPLTGSAWATGDLSSLQAAVKVIS